MHYLFINTDANTGRKIEIGLRVRYTLKQSLSCRLFDHLIADLAQFVSFHSFAGYLLQLSQNSAHRFAGGPHQIYFFIASYRDSHIILQQADANLSITSA